MQDAIKGLGALVIAALLAACGGGTSPTAQQNATTSKTLATTIALLNAQGASVTRVDEDQRLTARVTVVETTTTTSDGRVISTATVPAVNATVALTATGGTLAPASALTNSSGVAEFGLTAGAVAGAYALTANVTLAGASPGTASLSYMVERTLQPAITLVLSDAEGRPVSEAAPGDRLQVQVLAQKVRVDATGVAEQYEPAVNVVVQLSADEGQFSPSEGRVLTDAAGRASVVLIPGLRAGDLNVSATGTIEGKSTTGTASVFVRVPRVDLGSGAPFVAGRLSFDPPEIEAGGRATVLGRFVTEAGTDFDQPITVTLTSACSDAGAATLISPVLAAGARLNSSYTAGAGCTGQDTVTATADIPGQLAPVTAQGTIVVRPPRPRGVLFVEAEPTVIALRGRGTVQAPERSNVTFRVVSAAGIPVPNEPVTFALTTTAGGLRLLSNAGTTDINGDVVATVEAGNAAVAFAVIATVPATGESVQSTQLVVSTGGADQDSFSLSVETFNIEGWNFDGETTTITLRAADRFNNPAPDGTRLLFTVEGGSVEPVCETSGGACSVTLTSQAPRPTNGRVSLLVRTQGSESFTDLNGNGAFDAGEPFQDLPEAFRDDDEDGVFDSGELFVDLNSNGRHDPGNSIFDGAPCNSGCGGSVDVRRNAVIVFSTSSADIGFSPSSLTVDELSPRTVLVLISDLNGNLPPAGSTVEVTSDNGEIVGDSSFAIGNATARGPVAFPVSVIGDGTASSGRLNVAVTTPNGVVTLDQMALNDISVCDAATLPLPPGCDDGDTDIGVIQLTPPTIAPTPGTTSETNVVIRLLSSETPPRAFVGITPQVTCSPGAAVGLAPSLTGTVQPTDSTGATTARISIVAAANASGEAGCTVRAGTIEATVRILGAPPPPPAGSLVVQPSSVAVTGTNGTRTVALQTTVFNTATPAAPLAGATVTARCQTVNATDYTLTPQTGPFVTNAAGQVDVLVDIITGAAPAGQGSCELSVGAARVVVPFSP
jgi:hypothetical protein